MDTTVIYNDYLSGDEKALERLMEIYGDKLTLYINGYVKNLHDSEDLLIEVFAYLIDRRPNIKNSFESYAVYECPDCGASYIGDYTENKEHIYKETVIAPSCNYPYASKANSRYTKQRNIRLYCSAGAVAVKGDLQR